MAATLDGRIQGSDAVFEAKFMLPWNFSEAAAAEKYIPQLQHNMFVIAARTAVLSVITGGGKWVESRAKVVRCKLCGKKIKVKAKGPLPLNTLRILASFCKNRLPTQPRK